MGLRFLRFRAFGVSGFRAGCQLPALALLCLSAGILSPEELVKGFAQQM